MLTGHVAVALGARGLRSTLPLPLLLVASQLPDWADAAACATGIKSAPAGVYSHTLPATATLALVGFLAALAITRDLRGSGLVALVVMLHTAGDYITGIKPTWPGGPMIGMGLYTRPGLDFIFETAVILLCWLMYRRSFSSDRRRSAAVFALPAVLIIIQAVSDIVLALSPSIQKC